MWYLEFGNECVLVWNGLEFEIKMELKRYDVRTYETVVFVEHGTTVASLTQGGKVKIANVFLCMLE